MRLNLSNDEVKEAIINKIYAETGLLVDPKNINIDNSVTIFDWKIGKPEKKVAVIPANTFTYVTIVDAIIDDISQRMGIGEKWIDSSDEVKSVIRLDWLKIVNDILKSEV